MQSEREVVSGRGRRNQTYLYSSLCETYIPRMQLWREIASAMAFCRFPKPGQVHQTICRKKFPFFVLSFPFVRRIFSSL